MRKDRLYTAMAALTIAALTACSADEADAPADATKGDVISLTSALAATRVAGDPQTTQLNTAVKVGAFGLSGSTAVANGSNNQYNVAADGSLTAVIREMEWPATGSASIYAYAPYQSGWAYNANNVFSVSKDQSTATGYLASDLLYGTPQANPVAQTEDAIRLTFSHLLTKMTISIRQESDASTDLSKASVALINTKTATTLNPSTGVLGAATAASEADIQVISALGTQTSVSAVMVPQQVAAGTALVRLTVGSRVLTAKLGTATTFESGKSYAFVFNVPSDNRDVTLVAGAVPVKNWEAGESLGESLTDEADNVEADLGNDATEPALAIGR